MEKWIGISVLSLSLVTLLFLLIKNGKYRISLKKITVHWIIAAVVLFVLNAVELTSSYAVPITPLSLSTIAILGIPGLALVQGVYILL